MKILTFAATIVMAVVTTQGAFAQTAGQDIKKAGSETKNAAKDSGSAVKHTAKTAGKEVKHGTHKAAQKVADKTQTPPQ
jgi:predicted small secreted protein